MHAIAGGDFILSKKTTAVAWTFQIFF
jgi:hypothetical protein